MVHYLPTWRSTYDTLTLHWIRRLGPLRRVGNGTYSSILFSFLQGSHLTCIPKMEHTALVENKGCHKIGLWVVRPN